MIFGFASFAKATDSAPVSQVGPAPMQNRDLLSEEMQRRTRAIEEFKDELKGAQTPEERLELFKKFQAKRERQLPNEALASAPVSPEQRLSEIQSKFGNSPEAQLRFAALEKRMQSMEKMRHLLERLPAASTEERESILDEVQMEREKIAQQATIATNSMLARNSQNDRMTLASPEMQAMRAKTEERRREIEAFKEALDQATPEQRIRLFNEWRDKRSASARSFQPSLATSR